MPGNETNGVGNFWYSFDYGLVHFIALDGETDFPSSPEWPFVRDLSGNETHPTEDETYITDSGPFGYIKGNLTENESYEQYNWLVDDLAAVDRCKTPWVIAMSHRPMYSSQVSSYQKNVRNAFESVMLKYEVDAFLSGYVPGLLSSICTFLANYIQTYTLVRTHVPSHSKRHHRLRKHCEQQHVVHQWRYFSDTHHQWNGW